MTLLFTMILTITLIKGQTKLPAIISVNTTLTKAQSPYTVESNLTVNSGVTLKIEAGVVVKIGSLLRLTIKGTLIAQGSETDSIYFVPLVAGKAWSSMPCDHANIELYYVSSSGSTRFINASGGDKIVIAHCKIVSTARGNGEDCIAAHDTKKVIIDNITLVGAGGKIADGIKNDAIDLDTVDSCFITNSKIYNFSDDGLDIGTQTKYAYIAGNTIFNCNFAISIGEQSLAYLVNNVAYNNDAGFQVHTGATIYCDRNTLYANTDAIEAFHSEEGTALQTGGTAIITNTIFHQNQRTDISSQSSSNVTISYSISDKINLSGDNNMFADPQLNDPANADFTLKATSPCLTGGKPDVNGNGTRIGAIQANENASAIPHCLGATFRIYPNPVVDNLWIEPIEAISKIIMVTVYDVTGKSVYSKFINENNKMLNLKELKTGVYFIQLTADSQWSEMLLFIKQ